MECNICETCEALFFSHGKRRSSMCPECQNLYQVYYARMYARATHPTEQKIRPDKVEAVTKKYSTININTEIDKWLAKEVL